MKINPASSQISRPWSSKLLTVILSICLGLAGANALRAQALQGINGTVTDASGATVSGATITATNDATGVVNKTTTTSAGTYSFNGLLPAAYTLKIEAPGFQVSVHKGVGVEVSRIATVNVTLQPGDVQQTIDVTENVIALDTTQPALGTTIENKVVQELPTEIGGGRGRQIDSFLFLAPGVTGDTFSHRINGGVDFESEVVFNGIPMAQSETQGFQTIWNPPFDLVNQYNVLRSSFSAQYGLAQGVVTYQTASGTNQFHGNAFWIVRNEAFDARGAYNATRPVDKEHNYGFSVGGPISIPHVYNGKDRTFFHVSAEWYRLNQTDTDFMSLPTAAEKAGNFTGVATIYDPLTGNPFPNDTIPVSRFSPLSKQLLQYLPDPALGGLTNNQQSFRGVLPQRQYPWGFTIDHVINDKQSIHWAEWRNKQTSYGTETASRFAHDNPLASTTYNPNLGTVFLLNYSYTLTPNLVMTAGASWLGELNDQIQDRTSSAQIAFAALPNASQVAGINFAGPNSPSELGSPWITSINRKLGWVIENNWQWIHGKQTFNIGGEFRRSYQDDNECQVCAGNFNFSNNETAQLVQNPDGSSNLVGGNSFASFLLGTVDSANRIGSQELKLRNKDVSTYVQDDIKLTPKLTFNVGLRWDVMVPFTEADNNIVFFDPARTNPVTGTLGAVTKFGNCAGCAGVERADIHWTHFSPRGGFSYQVDNKTVLQGGFAMNYLSGGAYEYGTNKVAVNYGNLLLGSFSRPSTNSQTPGFGSWDNTVLPAPSPTPFSSGLGVGTQVDAFDPKESGRAPYDLTWNFGVQRELPGQMFLSVNYAANKANHLPSQLNPVNQLPSQFLAQYGSLLGEAYNSPAAIAAGIRSPFPTFGTTFGDSASVLQALRPYPQFSNVFNNFDNTGAAIYNALQFQLEKRYTSGLSFLVSYNLSRMISNTNSGFTSFAGASYNKNNQKSEWTVDNNDQTNAITIAGTYELPFGKGRKFLNQSGIANVVLGGWQLSPIATYHTGTPLFNNGTSGPVYVSGDPLGNNCNPCNRTNIVSFNNMMFSYNNVYKGLPVLNAADFADPGQWALGNSPRVLSQLRNPWGMNENIAVAKYFPLGEKVKLKIEMEYFNAMNRLIFGGPDLNLQDANFGKVINNQANTRREGQGHVTITF